MGAINGNCCSGRGEPRFQDKAACQALPPEQPLKLHSPAPEPEPESLNKQDIAVPDEKTLASLEEGQEVSFSVQRCERGWQAQEVTGLDGNPVRTRLHRNMLAGIFRGVTTHWNTEKAFGWISSDISPQSLGMQRVPKSVLGMNDGRIYFRWRDCGPSREGQEAVVQRGKAVVFALYWDEKGLGALQVCDAVTGRPLSSQVGAVDHYKQLLALQELPGDEQLVELGKAMGKCVVCLVVVRAQAGTIIGQKGETVKTLKETSGVDRIFVENGMSECRLVEIKGVPPAVASATLLIAEHLAREPGHEGSGLDVRLVVPDDGFGRVVGKGKAQLNAIQERCSGATLTIAPRASVGTGVVQAISVTGETGAVADAIRMLITRIVTCCSPLVLQPAGAQNMMQGGFGQNMGPQMQALQQVGTGHQQGTQKGGSQQGYGGRGQGGGGKGRGNYGGGVGGPKGSGGGAAYGGNNGGSGCGAKGSGGKARAPPPMAANLMPPRMQGAPPTQMQMQGMPPMPAQGIPHMAFPGGPPLQMQGQMPIHGGMQMPVPMPGADPMHGVNL
mmetsp:Transcript_41014/g.80969  ORF Transcript_41014/g.80969 Transcript_41014/m.80969 type:complete len:557 (-) Transcript_41014:112-1782(-)